MESDTKPADTEPVLPVRKNVSNFTFAFNLNLAAIFKNRKIGENRDSDYLFHFARPSSWHHLWKSRGKSKDLTALLLSYCKTFLVSKILDFLVDKNSPRSDNGGTQINKG